MATPALELFTCTRPSTPSERLDSQKGGMYHFSSLPYNPNGNQTQSSSFGDECVADPRGQGLIILRG